MNVYIYIIWIRSNQNNCPTLYCSLSLSDSVFVWRSWFAQAAPASASAAEAAVAAASVPVHNSLIHIFKCNWIYSACYSFAAAAATVLQDKMTVCRHWYNVKTVKSGCCCWLCVCRINKGIFPFSVLNINIHDALSLTWQTVHWHTHTYTYIHLQPIPPTMQCKN